MYKLRGICICRSPLQLVEEVELQKNWSGPCGERWLELPWMWRLGKPAGFPTLACCELLPSTYYRVCIGLPTRKNYL